MHLYYAQLDTPAGQATAAVNQDGEVVEFYFLNEYSIGPFLARPDRASRDESRLKAVIDQTREYFAGTRKAFDLPLCPAGTPFQQKVWRALCDIPFGTTISYQQLAIAIGDSNAMRAVGAANGRNPISLIIPCHRVIGKNGSLTGYGGGLPLKKWLLEFETPQARLF